MAHASSGHISANFEDLQNYMSAVGGGSESASSPEIEQSAILQPPMNTAGDIVMDALPLEDRTPSVMPEQLQIAGLSTSNRQVGAKPAEPSMLLYGAIAAAVLLIYCYAK